MLGSQSNFSQIGCTAISNSLPWGRVAATEPAFERLAHALPPALQVVSAALGLLTELPEFSPEQLITDLETHMLQVAAAAVQAAAAQPPDLLHAAAWTSAFAAYAAAVPLKLLAAGEDSPGDEGGGGQDQLRQALLQV